ncbi:hypothetical protein SHIRM173S_12175 [Streptomyces hirsutus]
MSVDAVTAKPSGAAEQASPCDIHTSCSLIAAGFLARISATGMVLGTISL